MTAYEQGFISKCAEYGVDGSVMLKQAQWARLLRRIANRGLWRGSGASRGFRRLVGTISNPAKTGKLGRYFELMGGGNAKTLDPYRKNLQFLYDKVSKLDPKSRMYKADIGAFSKAIKNLESAAHGGPMFRGAMGDVGMSTAKELAKVRAARVGTGMAAAGLAGTGILAGNAVKNQSKPYTPMNPEPFLNG